MSEFHINVVRINKVGKHPNADSLSITHVHGGYPCIFRTEDFKEGDLAVYVPVDSVVPDEERWGFLKGHRRIKARKLRGIFSMGLLTHPEPGWTENQNVQKELGITKFEPIVHSGLKGADNEPDQPFIPKYTDIEGLRKHPNILINKENVIITEKIHGANGRWLFKDNRFWVGSHNSLRKDTPDCSWWTIMRKMGLEEKLRKAEGIVFYGELFGNVQDLKYGLGSNMSIRMFDALDTSTMKYLNYGDFMELCSKLKIPIVPILYKGPWSNDLLHLAEGKTTLGNKDHIREGFVVKPEKERWDHSCGRVILKMIGEGYYLRKGG